MKKNGEKKVKKPRKIAAEGGIWVRDG